jgi:hypothetical protein
MSYQTYTVKEKANDQKKRHPFLSIVSFSSKFVNNILHGYEKVQHKTLYYILDKLSYIHYLCEKHWDRFYRGLSFSLTKGFQFCYQTLSRSYGEQLHQDLNNDLYYSPPQACAHEHTSFYRRMGGRDYISKCSPVCSLLNHHSTLDVLSQIYDLKKPCVILESESIDKLQYNYNYKTEQSPFGNSLQRTWNHIVYIFSEPYINYTIN